MAQWFYQADHVLRPWSSSRSEGSTGSQLFSISLFWIETSGVVPGTCWSSTGLQYPDHYWQHSLELPSSFSISGASRVPSYWCFHLLGCPCPSQQLFTINHDSLDLKSYRIFDLNVHLYEDGELYQFYQFCVSTLLLVVLQQHEEVLN